ncbi:MAG TPA: hypothetical protein VMQ76_12685 [Terracidiphilus sp.]|nr:hypothetical protein [Terracidiphilus sp.]
MQFGLKITLALDQQLRAEAAQRQLSVSVVAFERLSGVVSQPVKACVECGEAVDSERCPVCAMKGRGAMLQAGSEIPQPTVGSIDDPKDERMARALAAMHADIGVTGPPETDPAPESPYLTRCGEQADGMVAHGRCGFAVDKSRWLERAKAGRRTPCCADCEAGT